MRWIKNCKKYKTPAAYWHVLQLSVFVNYIPCAWCTYDVINVSKTFEVVKNVLVFKSFTLNLWHWMMTIVFTQCDTEKTKGWLKVVTQKVSIIFNCVNHETLISKLNFYGITGTANKLIKSYLSSRYQRVIIKDKYLNKFSSQWAEVKYGVPQGSVLGPLFFFYISTISQKLSEISNPMLFADDTNIIIANPMPTEFIKKH